MFPVPARIRLATFAIWESATVILNVLAFTLIGLQLGPILDALTGEQRTRSIGFALVILAVVIGIRLVLVLTHHAFSRRNGRLHDAGSGPTASQPLTVRGALVVGWAGMRGIVTLAAAMALPAAFPYRNFMQLTAFVVVLGTLVLQGFTLRPLLALVRLPLDHTLRQELGLARETVLRAALAELSNHDGPAADQLRQELADALSDTQRGRNPGDSPHNVLRCRLVATCRDAIEELRTSGAIGDDAYRQVEARLDWVELSARSHDDEDSRPSPTLG
jgi:CPA1 family monovalent cation:H+ antiporter